jgi:hypothetical protein
MHRSACNDNHWHRSVYTYRVSHLDLLLGANCSWIAGTQFSKSFAEGRMCAQCFNMAWQYARAHAHLCGDKNCALPRTHSPVAVPDVRSTDQMPSFPRQIHQGFPCVSTSLAKLPSLVGPALAVSRIVTHSTRKLNVRRSLLLACAMRPEELVPGHGGCAAWPILSSA